MTQSLQLYNTLTRKLEPFVPVAAPRVGMYLCGPTVYGPPHIGHARSAVVFDTMVRYLRCIGYQVCSVRNITDVGHLADGEEGEDKIVKEAVASQMAPMALATRYTNEYKESMRALQVLPPEVEPLATGHITEQIALVEQLLRAGYAYEVNGSVYFDLAAYQKRYPYGVLSNRKVEEMRTGSRPLQKGGEKRSPLDFALWKCASPSHIMRWPSPWGAGFPGWHLECTAMSAKYLSTPFDIHCGGMDLCFPHHECELAQGRAAFGKAPVKYWVHHNMVLIEGQKMSKSLGNFVSLQDCFSGRHPLLSQPFAPMVVRFFILQAHYRSTLNFSDQHLKAAQASYYKLVNGLERVKRLKPIITYPSKPDSEAEEDAVRLHEACYEAMNADLNTAKVTGVLFEMLRYINQAYEDPNYSAPCTRERWTLLTQTFQHFMQEVLGLENRAVGSERALLSLLLEQYRRAKLQRDYKAVDAIRAGLSEVGILVHDRPGGVDWSYSGRSEKGG